MFRTILVLLFLAGCGLFLHQQPGVEPAPAVQEKPKVIDDASLRALKSALPSVIFEKDIQPAIDRNASGGLTSAQIRELLERMDDIARALGGKAADAVERSSEALSRDLPSQKEMGGRAVEAASALARKVAQGVEGSMPAVKEVSGDIVQGLITLLSRVLSTAAELLQSR